jgi:hypothetical protein
MPHDQLSAMALADDPRTFWLTIEIITPQTGDEANLVLDSPWAFDVLEMWHFSEGAGGDVDLEIDSTQIPFDDTAANGSPVAVGAKVKSDVAGTNFTVGVSGSLVAAIVADTGCTKIVVQVMCRRLIAEATVT